MAAPKGNNFNPKGRPQKPIDWEEFEKLCALQCTSEEIASFLGIVKDTLYDRVKLQYGDDYSSIYKRFAESGKCSLRRNQFVLSKKNASMAIWLGKQWLGQKDMSKEEIKDIVEDLKDAIRESEGIARANEASRSSMAPEQSVLHQGCERQEDQVQPELGSISSQ